MRLPLLRPLALLTLTPAALLAQEGAPSTRPFMKPDTGLMVWTLVIFVILMFVLSKYAFGPLTEAVEKRERSLQEAIDAAKADREAAAKLLAERRAALDASHGEAQKIIVDARAAAERVRAELMEHAHAEQARLMDQVRQQIEAEKVGAIAELRREAVELAIAGASRVIEKNLDQPTNRQLVESFLASVTPASVVASR
jgi:F-type H+-transporting ATPase subunit b